VGKTAEEMVMVMKEMAEREKGEQGPHLGLTLAEAVDVLCERNYYLDCVEGNEKYCVKRVVDDDKIMEAKIRELKKMEKALDDAEASRNENDLPLDKEGNRIYYGSLYAYIERSIEATDHARSSRRELTETRQLIKTTQEDVVRMQHIIAELSK
jgi:hypothetical protein